MMATIPPPRRDGTTVRIERLRVWTATLAIASMVVLGCSRATPIPAGAQQVHVVVTASEVRLEPATVRAGEVYLVLDAPADGSFTFVMAKPAAEATEGPLDDDALARLARGDPEGTSISGLDAGGCSPEQNAADRGMLGPCGNVMLAVLTPGRYAVVGGSPARDPATGQGPPMAVLEVVP